MVVDPREPKKGKTVWVKATVTEALNMVGKRVEFATFPHPSGKDNFGSMRLDTLIYREEAS